MDLFETEDNTLNQDRRLAKNSAILMLSNIANKIAGFLIMLTVARFLGADRFGLYTYIFVYVSAFGLTTDLGLTTVVIRRLSRDSEVGRVSLGNALLIRWPVSLGTYALSVAGALLLYGWDERAWLIALSSLSFLTVPLATYTAIFNARLMLYGPALANLASKGVLFFAVQLIARSGGSLVVLIATEVFLGSVTSVGLWIWSRSLIRPSYRFDLVEFGRMLSEGIPLFLTAVFVTLYFRIDVFFLSHYRNDASIGIYAAAYRLTESLPLIASAVSNSIFPVICQQIHEGNESSLAKLVRVSLKILLAAIVPVVLLLAFYSNQITRLLYGMRYEGSATLLAILAWGQILLFSNILFSVLIVARGNSRVLMFITLGMLVLNFALNYLIIPAHGAVGAALTTVATELAGTLACVAVTSMARPFAQAISRLLIPAAICGLILVLFGQRSQPWNLMSIWPVMAVAVLYPAFLYLFRVFNEEEWGRLRNLV
jgi:O-antigen/teichoic acid export membrane protein